MSSETLRRPVDEDVREMPTVCHIPVCPFSQRLEILLALKGLGDRVAFHVVDIARPRPGWLLEKPRGTTALPVLETAEDVFPGSPVARQDPYRHAVENTLAAHEATAAELGPV